MIGKKEFSTFVTCINEQKMKLDENVTTSLKNLILIWKNTTENNKMLYLDNFTDYDTITDFVKKLNKVKLLKLWFDHVTMLTSQKLTSREQKDVRINIAHYEFKIKFAEKYEKLFPQEKHMLDFFRKITVLAILSGNSSYAKRSLIDKLLINCRIAPFSNIQCQNIEVRTSDLHGNGVFAKDDIPIGTIVTFYPVDGYNEDNSSNYKISEDWVRQENTNMEDHGCLVSDDDTHPLKIVANPNKISNLMLIGHMINDSIGNTFDGTTTSNIKNGIYEYYTKSNNNCKLKINKQYGIIYIITIKNIKKDQELTFSYGPLYWFTRLDTNVQHFCDVCNDEQMVEFIRPYLDE